MGLGAGRMCSEWCPNSLPTSMPHHRFLLMLRRFIIFGKYLYMYPGIGPCESYVSGLESISGYDTKSYEEEALDQSATTYPGTPSGGLAR